MDVQTRPSWDEYFLALADTVALRADCTRSKVGAVLVDRRGRVRGTGYNGSRPGGPSCLKGGCPRGLLSTEELAPESSYDTGPGACVAIHAELNMLLYTSPEDREGGTLYTTRIPCPGCMKILQGSNLGRMVWSLERGGSIRYGGRGGNWYDEKF